MRIGRASSLAAAKSVSSRARFRIVLGDARRRALAGGLDRRELVGVDALHVGRDAAAAQVQRVGPLELEVDLLGRREAAHEVGQQAGRHGRRAVGLDLAGNPVGDPDLEVRRGQLEAGVLGLEQDVGQHGQGAAAGDGPRDDREAASEVLLHDREFHVGLSPGRVPARRAGPWIAGGVRDLSLHLIITIIMPWKRGIPVRGRAAIGGGRTLRTVDEPRVGGRRGGPRWTDRGRRPADGASAGGPRSHPPSGRRPPSRRFSTDSGHRPRSAPGRPPPRLRRICLPLAPQSCATRVAVGYPAHGPAPRGLVQGTGTRACRTAGPLQGLADAPARRP